MAVVPLRAPESLAPHFAVSLHSKHNLITVGDGELLCLKLH